MLRGTSRTSQTVVMFWGKKKRTRYLSNKGWKISSIMRVTLQNICSSPAVICIHQVRQGLDTVLFTRNTITTISFNTAQPHTFKHVIFKRLSWLMAWNTHSMSIKQRCCRDGCTCWQPLLLASSSHKNTRSLSHSHHTDTYTEKPSPQSV